MDKITESTSRYDQLEKMSTADLLQNINTEDRTVAMEGSLLQDSFAGYQRHVYTVTLMP